MKSMWNTHYIKVARNLECPPGRPNIWYVMPEQSGGRSFRFPVNKMDINACHSFCELPDINGCTNETHELARLIMREKELEFPSNATEAKTFYFHYKKHQSTTTQILKEYSLKISFGESILSKSVLSQNIFCLCSVRRKF